MDLRLDHVLIAVADLDEAAARIGTHPGLTAFPGGRHRGVGTANMIVPLGRDYLELIAIVDEAEAATLQRSRRVRDAVEQGRTFAGWAVRTDNLDDLRRGLHRIGVTTSDPLDGARVRPDGVLLRWRTVELLNPEPSDPFFIQWQVPAGFHPGEHPAAHRSRATGIGKVTAGRGGGVIEMLAQAGIPVEVAGGEVRGLVSIELDAPAGQILMR